MSGLVAGGPARRTNLLVRRGIVGRSEEPAEAHEHTLARADATDIAVVARGSRALKFCRALRDIALMDSVERAEAVRALQEALGSYRAYEYFVSQGRHPVNADDDPQDLVIAADINICNGIARCRDLGMSDEDMLAAVEPSAVDGSP